MDTKKCLKCGHEFVQKTHNQKYCSIVCQKAASADKEVKRRKIISYEKQQAKWIEENYVKIGDVVKITRKAYDGENGWNNSWSVSMDERIGSQTKIESFCENALGIRVCFGGHVFPYFVLEKELSYEERQEKWIKENNIKKGDWVRITDENHKLYGKKFPINSINSKGIYLYRRGRLEGKFLYSMLEKTEEQHPGLGRDESERLASELRSYMGTIEEITGKVIKISDAYSPKIQDHANGLRRAFILTIGRLMIEDD